MDYMECLISSSKKRQIIDITSNINEILARKSKKGVKSINLVVLHTTCSLTTADLDAGGTDLDYLDFMEAITPKLKYRHPHDPGHVPDHILASMIGPSVVLPIKDSQLELGTWQRLVLIEFDGPRQRTLKVNLLS
jgi:secondary thiamine-phosphate synthase enzyme